MAELRWTAEALDWIVDKKPTYKDGVVWINPTQRFEGVPEVVWNFHVGGYQVCEKWLKDRRGRTLLMKISPFTSAWSLP